MVTSILFIFTAVLVVLNVWKGFAKGMSRSLLRLAVKILAVVGAFILAKSLMPTISRSLVSLVEENLFSNPELAAKLEDAGFIFDSVALVLQMLATPIVFCLIYLVLKLVLMIPYFIIASIVCHKKSFSGRLVGLGIGLVSGLISVLVFSVPLFGYADIVSTAITELADPAKDNSELESGVGEVVGQDVEIPSIWEINENYLIPASKTPVMSQVYRLGGNLLFEKLSTVEFEGTKTSLKHEAEALIHIVQGVEALGGSELSKYGDREIDALHNIADATGESRFISSLGSGVFYTVSTAWLSGEEAFGAPKPEFASEEGEIVLDSFLEVLSTSNVDNFGEDMRATADMFGIFHQYDLFTALSAGSAEEMTSKFANNDFLDAAFALVDAHPRMEPVKYAITDIGMRTWITYLGEDPSTYMEDHPELMDSIANTLKDAVTEDNQIDEEKIFEEMTEIMTSYEVSVDEETAHLVAKGLAHEFTVEDLTEKSTEELIAMVIDRLHLTK